MVAAARIAEVRTRLHRGTLRRPWGADVTGNHVEVEVVDTTGWTGVGFSWTPSIGAYAVQAMLDHDIWEAVLGWTVDPEDVWPALLTHLHEVGSGGVTTIAMAGLDLALWDLAGRRRDLSLAAMLRRRRHRVGVYGSGVNLPARHPRRAGGAGATLGGGGDALDLGACDVVQPNVVRVSGVTPFVRIAALAAERGAELHPHSLADPSPVAIRDGALTETGSPGLVLRFLPALADVAG
jgi:L-alanine-DL-glutamate epimerase-like enolase superfamily enzyme